ncbi:unnamed protein product [Soboliphyme baturini]|uniref:Transposase n=1 Tax=Soboliphyme baturini TaxID=241478 RepID=A0A183ISU5_9BILA|nr:unnamed protein product [Soboliphyme baturini]
MITDVETKWQLFNSAILEATAQRCGFEWVGLPPGGQKDLPGGHERRWRAYLEELSNVEQRLENSMVEQQKGDYKECSNYMGITLVSHPGKVNAEALEKKCPKKLTPRYKKNSADSGRSKHR